jgi:hypothetical protein
MGTGCLPGIKEPGHDVDHPLPFRTEVKEKAELHAFVAY